MEVHHHPHVEKKSFKEYFLEFLMILLAVTMGFIAENIREHYTEKIMQENILKAIAMNLSFRRRATFVVSGCLMHLMKTY